jgi:hypothetical protein
LQGNAINKHPKKGEKCIDGFDLHIFRNLPILETQYWDFSKVLETGTLATNVFLRRIHNFALDPELAELADSAQGAMTESAVQGETCDHLCRTPSHIAAEQNPARRAFYACSLNIGGAQSALQP